MISTLISVLLITKMLCSQKVRALLCNHIELFQEKTWIVSCEATLTQVAQKEKIGNLAAHV